jgi:hypothetical protein
MSRYIAVGRMSFGSMRQAVAPAGRRRRRPWKQAMQGQSWRERQFHAGDEPAADSPVRLAVGERIPVRAA